MSGVEDSESYRRKYKTPYNPQNKVPTVQQYRARKSQQRDKLAAENSTGEATPGGTWSDRAWEYWYGSELRKRKSRGHDSSHHDDDGSEDESGGINDAKTDSFGRATSEDEAAGAMSNGDDDDDDDGTEDDSNVDGPGGGNKGAAPNGGGMKDTTEVSGAGDAKAKRKSMKKGGRERAEREVTDPITHLPVTIHDFTDKDLDVDDQDEARQNDKAQNAPQGHQPLSNKGKTTTGNSTLDGQRDDMAKMHRGMQHVFPPPQFDAIQEEMSQAYRKAWMVSSVAIFALLTINVIAFSLTRLTRILHAHHWARNILGYSIFGVIPFTTCIGILMVTHKWVQNHVEAIWDDELWYAQKQASRKPRDADLPESTQWFNMLLRSIWPLVNPDLFSGLSDTLEDIMQASLPSLVKMISVDDLGQGSEPLRILGIRWLPKGAAGRSVSVGGEIESAEDKRKREAAKESPQGEKRDGNEKQKQDGGEGSKGDKNAQEQAQEGMQEGLQAEEGDFVNMELAFAYRANKSRKTFRDRARNAHLLLSFYLPGNIKLPVWVELRGIVGSMRARMQITPDPPFIALTTITLLGQPKVNLSCVPLSQHGLNIMDIPLISNFVQSAVDAAMSEYVAPKSLTLDLKSMITGDDFKKDTTARGILRVRIKRAFDFKEGDTSIPLISEGKSDAYVSVGWAKFGKPLFSTRVIISDMEPWWQEETHLLVSAEELDADEKLRVQLWDSDRFTADDDLGRIELDLKELMRSKESNGKMQDREDAFEALAEGQGMPGRLEWSVGYFSKLRIQDWQVKQQKVREHVNSVEELKQVVYAEAEKKLKEATKDETAEVEQLKKDDLLDAEIDLLTAAAPDENYPSGILSVHIHQIVGLELEQQRRPRNDNEENAFEEEQNDSDSLPSSYCTVIINHQKVYKTRTKPKNAKPFFNASTERFIRDWRTTSLLISVRDARLHEDDALLGLITLPIGKLFREKQTSRFNDFYPIAGGVGYGRARISVVFRSVQLQLPKQSLGWDWGTLVVEPEVRGADGLEADLKSCRLKFSTKVDKGKMHAASPDHAEESSGGDGKPELGLWIHGRRQRRPIRLAVRQRYCRMLMIEFRPSSSRLIGNTRSAAYAVLWLQDIPDAEPQTLTLPVYSLSKAKELLTRASQNFLPESERGEKVGAISLRLRFERGLSERHAPLAKHNQDVGNLMEVISVIKDNELGTEVLNGEPNAGPRGEGEATAHNADDQSDSSDSEGSSSSDEEDTNLRDGEGGKGQNANASQGGDRDHGKSGGIGGMVQSVKDAKEHQEQLHRRQRGVMQWKAPRTARWLKGKAERLVDRVESKFEHHEREPEVETEV